MRYLVVSFSAAAHAAGPTHRTKVGFAILLMTAMGLGACGLRTSPKPLSETLPAAGEVSLHQQDRVAIVIWARPQVESRGRGVEGYRVSIERRALVCTTCAPEYAESIDIEGDALTAARYGKRFAVAFPHGDRPSLWHATVTVHYAEGFSRASQPVTLEAPVRLPQPSLSAKWQPGQGNTLVLRWKQRRDRVVQILSSDGKLLPRETFLRGNIYQRASSGEWPLLPLNPAPTDKIQWTIDFLVPNPSGMEFGLRLVDEFGNEGPLSAPVKPPLRRPSS